MGGVGLHPWELWEYTLEDYLARRRGYYKEQDRVLKAHYQHTRLQSYYAVVYNPDIPLNIRKKSIDKLIPDAYAPVPKEEDRAAWYEKQRQHAIELSKRLKGRAPRRPQRSNGK